MKPRQIKKSASTPANPLSLPPVAQALYNPRRCPPAPVDSARTLPPVTDRSDSIEEQLPRATAKRMKIDVMMSPSVLALRVNRANIVNEIKQYNGSKADITLPDVATSKALHTQLAVKKPRRRQMPLRLDQVLDPSAPSRWNQRTGMACLLSTDTFKKIREEKNAEAAAAAAQAHRRSTARNLFADKETRALRRYGDAEADLPSLFRVPQAAEEAVSEHAIEVAKQLEDAHFGMVYRSLQQDDGSGLPRARVHRTLEALGFVQPDSVVIQESLRELPTTASGVLSMNDFAKVVVDQRRHQRNALKEIFRQLDTMNTGYIHSRELRPVLRDLGFAMTPEAIKELLQECGVEYPERMTCENFEMALALVRDRYGFTLQEVQKLEALFDRYDYDKSGDMSADELSSAMGWLGMPTPISQAQSAIARFDLDGNSRLCRPEFLLAVRWWRDEEVESMRNLFSEHDSNDDGILDVHEIKMLFERLGYTISLEVIEEGMKKVKSHSQGLFFEEILQLLQAIRSQEGFSDAEAAELMEIHRRFDRSEQGLLRPFELTRALNWLGYPISQHRREQLWCRVDVDKSGFLEPNELLKLIRILREEENAAGKKLLKDHDGCSRLRLEDLKHMLHTLGYAPSGALLQEAIKASLDSNGDGMPDVAGVCNIIKTMRESQVAKLRQNAGLSDLKVERIQSKFGRRFDSGKSIEPSELEKLMHGLFPTAARSEDERSRLHELIEEYHKEHGISSFEDVFWIVRLYSEVYDEHVWQREADVIADTGFSPAEVAQFREAFVECDADGSGALSEDEIYMAFDESICVAILQDLKLQNEVKRLKKDHQEKVFDFPEFLRFAKHAIDEGWIGGSGRE